MAVENPLRLIMKVAEGIAWAVVLVALVMVVFTPMAELNPLYLTILGIAPCLTAINLAGPWLEKQRQAKPRAKDQD